MPINIRTSQDGELITISGFGEIKSDEFIEFHKELLKSPEKIATIRWILYDWADVEQARVKAETIRETALLVVKTFTRFNTKGRIAVIATKNVIYGLARMCIVYKEGTGWEMEIFRERQQALEWLLNGLDKNKAVSG
jgi:hypothetical protein